VDRFFDIALSFPTLILSLLLLVAVGYWLLTLLGLLDLEVLDLPEVAESEGLMGVFSGLLLKCRLQGLPVALIYSAVVLIAWVFVYLASALLFGLIDSAALRLAVGAVAIPFAVFLALPFAGLALQPLKGLFARVEGRKAESLLGEIVRIRSAEATAHAGTADYDDGAAGLILQVRAAGTVLKRGERALIVEYLEGQNAYRVTPP
jgi:hypothetical protein